MNSSPRKLANRRFNEHLRLFASLLNALAIGLFGAAIIIPGVAAPATFISLRTGVWFFAAAALHLVAQAAVSFLRSED
jgi:hypothetical protein